MGFAVGETVGQFKILEYVGQGGMATIYKAHQLTLDRDVALKVIHPALKDDQSFLTRLSREATIIAKLSHPNIVAVYDFSQFEGIPFLVLQYIDGKTLKAVLQDQKLGTQQVLKIIRPVADALTYAHSRGVLHRDVKPSNILIDTEGHVFLTDFGLARITYSTESTSSHDMMIGSPNYLSPEQAKSEAVDVHTDVYSLGIVAYEMFVGRLPFARDTPYATILAQINDPPPSPRSVNPKVPLAVEQVLLKALAKDPKQRYNSVRDMMRALENAVRGPMDDPDEQAAAIPLVDYRPARSLPLAQPISSVRDQLKTAASSIGKSGSRRPLLIAGAAVIAAAVLLLCLIGAFLIALQTPLLRTNSAPRASVSASTSVAAGIGATAALSPTARITPRFTPTAASTAAPTAAANTPTAALRQTAVAAAAGPKGKIAYSVATGDQAEQHSVWVANADGSNPVKVADTALWPAISRDGKRIAYYRMKEEGIYIANIDGSDAHRILVGETCCVQWSADNERLMYVAGKLKIADTRIVIANTDGTTIQELLPGSFNPAWAPDGNRIVYVSTKPNTNSSGLFVYDLAAQTATMITTDGGSNPQWSPRGDKIVYQAGGNPANVFEVNPDGSGMKQLTAGKSNDIQPTWSSDGSYVFWRSDQDGKGWAIYRMRSDGSDKRLLINDTPPDQSEKWGGRESLSAGP